MITQSANIQWINLRWRHYYEWKNLLDAEREARQLLEVFHRQQLDKLPLAERWIESVAIVKIQLDDLVRLRQENEQKRQRLKEHQAQEVTRFRQQTATEKTYNWLDNYAALSVLRRA